MAISFSVREIRETQQQYLVILTGAYFVAGFFWVFFALGSVKLGQGQETITPFFYSMIVLMLSNGVWEILTGWYADKFKRRFSISAGFFVCFAGFLLMGVASFIPSLRNGSGQFNTDSGPRLLLWLAGVTVWSLGPALLSGAQEAWLVDRCNFLSADPPEPIANVFKTAARLGVIAKASGALICFFVLFFLLVDTSDGETEARLKLSFSLAGGLAAISSALLGYYSLRLQEEYWTDPKYQSEESLLAFLWMGMKDLWKVPYRWFTLAFIGATVLNYTLSSAWAYFHKGTIYVLGEDRKVEIIVGGIIVIELAAGYLSKTFSQRIDRIKQPKWRMPVASLMYLLPVLPLYLIPFSPKQSDVFLFVLIAATFSFRTAHASVFGTLNAVGQLLIESDERRAMLISMSSALAAFFMALAFIVINNSRSFSGVEEGIQFSWVYITLPSSLMLAGGGYLVARGVRN
jgi:MFS family permease